MTTERRVSPLELRWYVVALLAAVYTISWRVIGAHAPAPEMAATPPRPPEPRFVWLDSMPPTTRPAIALPSGWKLASAPELSSPAPSHVVRVSGPRVPRVRTRSS